MEKTKLKAALEALLFMSTEPISVNELKKLVSVKAEVATSPAEGEENTAETQEVQEMQEDSQPVAENDAATQLDAMQVQLESEISKNDITDALDELIAEYAANETRGFELAHVAKGYQFRTKPEQAMFLKGLGHVSKFRLSAPSMETLAIVAYQQPLPRNKVEEIRGVDSGGVLKTLLDRDLVRIVGRSEEPGRPILYGTTKTFLEVFNLSSLADLPTLKDLEEGALPAQGTMSDLSDESDVSDDFEEDVLAFSEAQEASGELIDELENSMRGLRDLEKKIFEPVQPAEEPQTSPKEEG